MSGVRYVRLVESKLTDRVAERPVGSMANAPGECARLLAPLIGSEPQEVFVVLALDGRHRVVGFYEVSRGTLTSSLVHPREVFAPALRLGNVAALIVAHNHPSGDMRPSPEDEAVTKVLVECGKLLKIPVLDSLVIGTKGSLGAWYSIVQGTCGTIGPEEGR